MRLHLAGISGLKNCPELCKEIPYALESFYYWADWEAAFFPIWKGFMLDSGAFTFAISGKGIDSKFDSYVDRYCDFVKAHDIKLYIEMDIDALVGYDRVRQIRRYIENRTGKQCIPVWHIPRGIADLKATCKDYPYIALGSGSAAKGGLTLEQKRRVIDIAHENGAQIHGLAQTGNSTMSLGWDSVDSTSWTAGMRFGQLPMFKKNQIVYHKEKRRRIKLSDKEYYKIAIGAWVKMQKYAEKFL